MISFNTIKSLFDTSCWDVGVISAEQLKQVSNYPIKNKFHVHGMDYTNTYRFPELVNTVVLVRKGHTWDYGHYDESIDILKASGIPNWFPLYTNYKEAVMVAGLGVKARNSLIYSYEFGFDFHAVCYGFWEEITDIPSHTRINHKLWSRCTNCYDCVDACPAKAIHAKQEPFWLDGAACEDFILFSDHPTVPSVKKFWHEKVHPEFPIQVVTQVKTAEDADRLIGGMKVDANGYTYDGNQTKKDGEPVYVYHCRECTSQPRCSKWGGKYPYDGSDQPHAIETQSK
jgi:ferredoxin